METKRNKLDHIHLRSEQVNEVLESPPRWLIRWGSTVICLLIVMLFVMACLIRYPEFVDAPIVISSQNPPEKLEATINSKIEKIFVSDQAAVKKDQVILLLESNADYKDVMQLKAMVDDLTEDKLLHFPLEAATRFKLGEVQDDYTAFAKAIQDELLFSTLKPYDAEGVLAGRNIRDYQHRIVIMKQQYALEGNKLELTETNYKRSELLKTKGVISTLELENEKMKLLEQRKNYKNIQLSLAQLEESILTFKNQQTNVTINKSKDRTNFSTGSLLMLEKLRKSIHQWERAYLIKSSINGKVSYLKFLAANQFVKAGTVLLSILPDDRSRIVGQMHIAAQNQGKIKPDQNVLIKLDNYRYQEFGMAKGVVKSLSFTPDEDGKYYLEVTLQAGLKTSYGKQISFDKELTGQASIVTEKMSLAARIMNQLRSAFRYQQN
ncbi:putative HlyD-family transporter [Pedobacter sp. BAL39]|uniref:HlyD family efflux transporter periplasmic adaptor subunit n=1 Tax=Pedobacter sp. BAL39 TaxID=391596 RepID=UPI0001559480|nr:HlyD family efflux transporter periplasmic adaptor subunit [Pedobacter sp. BAL39]EDM34794.1 putative HlyD-family transporter [Pedobacter sp. BAL39]